MSIRFFMMCMLTFHIASISLAYAMRPCELIGKCIDVIEEIKKPFEGRLCDKLGLPCVDVIDGVKHVLTEAQVQAIAPLFAEWLRASRNTSRGGSNPIPVHIQQELQGFYGNDILGSVRYKIGDSGIANLGGLSIRYGDARAVTLIDVIVFNNESDVNDPQLWVHELRHVEQFLQGVDKFAIQYLRELRHEHNPLENDARNAEQRYQQLRVQQHQQSSSSQSATFPSGHYMKGCGCWGPNPNPKEPEPRCASGWVVVNVCQGTACAPGHPLYSYICW